MRLAPVAAVVCFVLCAAFILGGVGFESWSACIVGLLFGVGAILWLHVEETSR